MRAVEEADQPAAAADEAILPSHAWMVGLAVDDDGTLIPPPVVAGSTSDRETDEPDEDPLAMHRADPPARGRVAVRPGHPCVRSSAPDRLR
jgi:hypothetical protein